MKRKAVDWFCLMLVLTGSVLVFSGCATGKEDSENASVRPWNAPMSWETGLPSNMTEGR